jgi:hypothetical protein
MEVRVKKSKFRVGDRVITNARYKKTTGFEKPIEGRILRETGWQAEVWLVQMDGFAKPQRVHESMMEKAR